MSQLEYDDSAFVFFGLSVLCVFALPFTFSFIRNNVLGSNVAVKAEKAVARSSLEKHKFTNVKAKETSVRRFFTCSFLFKLIIVVFCWLAIVNLAARVGNVGEMRGFDPYEILGIERGATDAEIKKQYRRLSVKWHPDRNTDNPIEASRMFMKIAKANEALTDPIARENWEKFGNPDGKQPMEVSLGLPTWLLMPENHNVVLVLYLLVLVVAIPVAVGTYYSNSKQYGEKMILNESYQVFAYLLNSLLLKHMPEALSLSAEFRAMPFRPEDEKPIERLKKVLIANEMMVKRPWTNAGQLFKRWPQTEKVNILLHAHMNRMATSEYLTPELEEDLVQILNKAPMLLDAMVEVAQTRKSLRLVHRVIDLSQFIVQAMWIGSSPLMQLPYFAKAEVKHATSGKGSVRTLEQFAVGADKDGFKQKGMAKFSEEQCKEIQSVVNMMPFMDFKVQIGVMDYEEEDGTVVFEDVAVHGDVITVYMELTYAKEATTKNRQIVHAPFFPVLIEDAWEISLTRADNDFCINSVKVTDTSKVTTKLRTKMLFPSQELKAGVQEFDVYLKSYCYAGLDLKRTVKVDLKPPGTVKAPETHPDDLNIAQEPALFDLMAGIEQDVNSDFESDNDDEDDDDDDEEEDSKKKTTQRTDGAKSKPEVVEIEDSDEESDDDLVAVEHSDAPVGAK